jgi:hypothetical protein
MGFIISTFFNIFSCHVRFKKEALQDFHRFKSILLSLVQQRMESPQRTSTASHKTVTCTTLPLLGFTDTFLEKFYQGTLSISLT